MSKRKVSSVWEFFTEEDGTAFAQCSLCQKKIRRGKDGARKSWSATVNTTLEPPKYPESTLLNIKPATQKDRLKK